MKIHVTDKAAITLLTGDITDQTVDAIVNAANSTLYGGGGVDGAIHDAGGPRILEECRRIRNTQWKTGLPTSEAVATTAGELSAKYVIHTVGPRWRGGTAGEPELLARAYRNCIHLADSLQIKSIAFPSLSTGAYGYPMEPAAQIALETLSNCLQTLQHVRDVRMVLFQRSAMNLFADTAQSMAASNNWKIEQ